MHVRGAGLGAGGVPRLDAGLAVAVAAGGAVEVAVGQVTGPLWATAASAVLFGAPLAWRRAYPWTALLVVLATVLGLHLAGGSDYNYLASVASVLLVVFTFAGLVELGQAVAGLVLAAAVLVVSSLEDLPGIIWGIGLVAGAWAAGRAIRARRLLIEQLHRTTEELRRSQEAHARAAIAQERTQIARELHDVIAHAVSVMVIQAGAAERMIPIDAQRASHAARSVQDAGRQALAELRRMLGVLRPTGEAESDLAPHPGLGDLPALLDGLGDAGLRVELTRTGQARPLPPGLDLAAFRIVQEALTNVLRHAGTGPASVSVCYHDDAVALEISDTGADPPPAQDPLRRGHGLAGMRERALVYGGSFEAGPRTDGGFAVRAWLPSGTGR